MAPLLQVLPPVARAREGAPPDRHPLNPAVRVTPQPSPPRVLPGGPGRRSPILAKVMDGLGRVPSGHAPSGPFHRLHGLLSGPEVSRLFAANLGPAELAPFGHLQLEGSVRDPIVEMMGVDHLILFAFYWANRRRYRRAVDIGAGAGLHSVILSRAGYEVRSYEPEPDRRALLERNLARNGCTPDRVTGSCPAGHREIGDLYTWADLVRIDVDGGEAEIVRATGPDHWWHADAVIRVGSEKAAAAIYRHLAALGVVMNAQKSGWKRVRALGDVPASRREGWLFVSTRSEIAWS